MRRPRMTTRRWMVAVAIGGGDLGMFERHERFRWIGVRHRAELPRHLPRIKPVGMEDKVWRLLVWHESMARKYERAARYPWFPVEPDPPEPQ